MTPSSFRSVRGLLAFNRKRVEFAALTRAAWISQAPRKMCPDVRLPPCESRQYHRDLRPAWATNETELR